MLNWFGAQVLWNLYPGSEDPIQENVLNVDVMAIMTALFNDVKSASTKLQISL